MMTKQVDAPVANFHDLPLMLTVEETAQVLRIGRNGAYEAIASGTIPSIKIGSRIRVPRKALAVWLTDGNDAPPTLPSAVDIAETAGSVDINSPTNERWPQ